MAIYGYNGCLSIYHTHDCITLLLIPHRMEGMAEYVFPTGTKYVGEMKDGM